MIRYLKQRLEERTTWAAIGIGVTAAAAISWPWNVLLALTAVIGVLTPSPGASDA